MCACVCCRGLIGNTTGLQINGWRIGSLYWIFSPQPESSNTLHLFLKASKREGNWLNWFITEIVQLAFEWCICLLLRYGAAIVWSDTHSRHSSNEVDSYIKSQQSIRVKRTQNGTKPEISPNNGDSKSLLLLLVTDPGNQAITCCITFLWSTVSRN